jgi:hypothetical protein
MIRCGTHDVSEVSAVNNVYFGARRDSMFEDNTLIIVSHSDLDFQLTILV